MFFDICHNGTSCLPKIDEKTREKLYLRYDVEPKYVNPKHTSIFANLKILGGGHFCPPPHCIGTISALTKNVKQTFVLLVI